MDSVKLRPLSFMYFNEIVDLSYWLQAHHRTGTYVGKSLLDLGYMLGDFNGCEQFI